MIEITFSYEGSKYNIQSSLTDKMKDIFKNFKKIVHLEKNALLYLYYGSTINEELELERVINDYDKQLNKMEIMAYLIDNNIESNSKSSYKSKDVFCPQCGEICLLKMDNFKIKLDVDHSESIFSLSSNSKNSFANKNNCFKLIKSSE